MCWCPNVIVVAGYITTVGVVAAPAVVKGSRRHVDAVGEHTIVIPQQHHGDDDNVDEADIDSQPAEAHPASRRHRC